MTLQASHHAVQAGMTTVRQALASLALGIVAQAHLALVAGTVVLAQAIAVLQVHQAGINYASRYLV